MLDLSSIDGKPCRCKEPDLIHVIWYATMTKIFSKQFFERRSKRIAFFQKINITQLLFSERDVQDWI